MTSTAPLAVLAAAACLLAPAAAAAHQPTSGDPERALAHRINHFRIANGKPRVHVSRTLSHSARRYARNLIQWDWFGHASRIQASGSWRVLGEVLAFRPGRIRSTRWAMRAWKSSPGHRAVLLDGRFRRVGLGRAAGRWGRGRATVWTVQLGRRR